MRSVARGFRAGAVRACAFSLVAVFFTLQPAISANGPGAVSGNLYVRALRADEAVTAGRFDDAIAMLTATLKQYPQDPNVDMIYGLTCEAYLGKKHDMMAESYCSAAIMRNDHMPRYVAARALANYRMGNRLGARRDADAALALGGAKPWLYGLKARLLWEDGEFVAARTMASTVVARDEDEENARFVLNAWRQKGTDRSREPQPPSVSPLPRGNVTGMPPVENPKPRPKPAVPLSLTPDCLHPANKIERWVCQDKDLQRRQSVLMARLTRAQVHAAGETALSDDVRTWVATRRNNCADKACLRAAYDERLSVLALWSWD